MVNSGELVSCQVEVPGNRPQTEYRLSAAGPDLRAKIMKPTSDPAKRRKSEPEHAVREPEVREQDTPQRSGGPWKGEETPAQGGAAHCSRPEPAVLVPPSGPGALPPTLGDLDWQELQEHARAAVEQAAVASRYPGGAGRAETPLERALHASAQAVHPITPDGKAVCLTPPTPPPADGAHKPPRRLAASAVRVKIELDLAVDEAYALMRWLQARGAA